MFFCKFYHTLKYLVTKLMRDRAFGFLALTSALQREPSFINISVDFGCDLLSLSFLCSGVVLGTMLYDCNKRSNSCYSNSCWYQPSLLVVYLYVVV